MLDQTVRSEPATGDARDFSIGTPDLADPACEDVYEVFGPLGQMVRCRDAAQTEEGARMLKGRLGVTLQMDDDEGEPVCGLLPILERKTGRLLANGFPTGVEVADAVVHGGPYPASTNYGATSDGILSIRRFLRPVGFQNMPEGDLSDNLRG